MAPSSGGPDVVTVVVPAYNAERFIEACLRSILSQTHTVAEVLVVNDGSTDSTEEIAAGIGEPVRVLTQENAGVSVARNLGLREASAPFVAFCDADDLWSPEKLERQMAVLASHPSASAAFSGAMEVDDALETLGVIPCPSLPDISISDLLFHRRGEIPPQISSTLVARKGRLEKAGGWDPDLSDAADWDMALRLRRLGPFVGPCDPLIKYRVHPGSMSAGTRLRAVDARRLFAKHLAAAAPEDRPEIRAAWGRNTLVLAASLARSEGFPAAAGWLSREVIMDPWPVGKALIGRLRGDR